MKNRKRSLAIEWDDGTCKVLHTLDARNVPEHDGYLITVEHIGNGWFEIEPN